MIRHEPESAGTNVLDVLLRPSGDAPLPVCSMSGRIPIIEWNMGLHRLEISLGSVTDPGDYLRRLARQLTAFSFDVDAEREQREPSAIGGGL